MRYTQLFLTLGLLCVLQQPKVHAASSSSAPSEVEPFFVRVYVDNHERAYIAVGKGNNSEGVSFASSQEFVQHVGPVVEKFIDLCGENLGGILTTDFNAQYPLAPLILTDLDKIESWIYHSKFKHRLHLLRRNYYAPKLRGKAIEMMAGYTRPPRDCELLFEVVCYEGKPVGIIQDDEFISPEKFIQITKTVLAKIIRAQNRSTPIVTSSEYSQGTVQKTAAEKFLYRHLDTILFGISFAGDVCLMSDGYGFGALTKGLYKKTTSFIAGKLMGWLWKDYVEPHGREAIAACKEELCQRIETMTATGAQPEFTPEPEPCRDLMDLLMKDPYEK